MNVTRAKSVTPADSLTFYTILHSNKCDIVIKCEQRVVCHAAQWFILVFTRR